MNLRCAIAFFCASSLLIGCATGERRFPAAGDAVPFAATAATTDTGHHGKAKVEIRIRVPRRSKHPDFISPATKGIAFALSGTKSVNVVAGLTPASDPNCHAVSGGTKCILTLSLAPGTYAMNVSTYDAAPVDGKIPGGANLLSAAKNVAVSADTGKPNSIGVTLSGVPASFAFADVPSGTAGTAFGSPQSFDVTVKDASGATIVGTYENAVMLTDGDTSGATSIATSGADSPPAGKLLSSNDGATLNYSGLSIAPAAIHASATGAKTGSTTFAPTLQSIVLGTNDALNPSFVGVDLYATNGTGSSAGFTASLTGWTNAPYNKKITATPGSGCSSIANVAPASGTSFTATTAVSPSAGTCTLALAGGGQTLNVALVYGNFGYTGGEQDFAVPSSVTQITVMAAGGQGGDGEDGLSIGGLGGSVTATVPVTPLETLALYVAGLGGEGVSTSTCLNNPVPGYNGGGFVGCGITAMGGAGGGASDVREGGKALANRIVVAGGGGGGGAFNSGSGPAPSGGAGGQTGGDGYNGTGATSAGYGGTASAGGFAGTGTGCQDSFAGSLGLGGGSANCKVSGGAGGGGYYGGGGAGGWSSGCCAPFFGGGAGGGSSYAEPSATNTSFASGTQSNNGQIVLIF